MFRILFLLLIPFAAGLFFFWRGFVRRALTLLNVTGKPRAVLVWLLPLVLSAALFGAFSAAGILYLHFFLLCALSGLTARFLRGRKAKTLLCTGLPALLLTVLIGLYAYANMRTVVETDYTVFTDKPLAQSCTAILVADVHYGTALDKQGVSALCDRLAALRPDVLLLGGDIVDESTPAGEVSEVFRLFGAVPTNYGVYYVSGNHDRGGYRRGAGHDIEAALAGTGIVYLRDESVELGSGLLLLGRRDKSDAARRPVAELLADRDPDRFCLILDHQPREYALNAAAGADLTLSGHTHAGQILPANLFTTLFGSELNYGLTERDGMTAIVTSGASGWGFPLRTSRHSEFVRVTVVPRA